MGFKGVDLPILCNTHIHIMRDYRNARYADVIGKGVVINYNIDRSIAILS